MPTFADNFHIGDVVFGLSHARTPYLKSLDQKDPNLRTQCEQTGAFLILDSFNNRSWLGGSELFQQNSTELTKIAPRNKADLDYNWNYYENDWGSVALMPEIKKKVRDYFDALKASRRSPYEAVNAPAKKYLSKGDLFSTMVALRRASKFGLEYVIIKKKQTVHFALDVPFQLGTMMDMNDVIAKKKCSSNNSVPFTFSELRCCYRNRVAWSDGLKFYLNLQEVLPPWETNPGLWQEYDHARFVKHHPIRAALADFVGFLSDTFASG